jgi:2-keto-4-pentenoate hydratase/2-oxohepta-3-ene-1,7-dioic acid hydratase in catechol pathway
LACIISKTGKNIKRENYLDYIGGYFLVLDLTDRSFQKESKDNSWPWFFAKSQDNFLPISKFVEKNLVKDPHNLDLNLWINGEIRQKDNTGNMHYKLPETIEFISKYITLNEGDILLTGTPSGIGEIKVGDKLKASLIQEGQVLVDFSFDVEEDKFHIKF